MIGLRSVAARGKRTFASSHRSCRPDRKFVRSELNEAKGFELHSNLGVWQLDVWVISESHCGLCSRNYSTDLSAKPSDAYIPLTCENVLGQYISLDTASIWRDKLWLIFWAYCERFFSMGLVGGCPSWSLGCWGSDFSSKSNTNRFANKYPYGLECQ